MTRDELEFQISQYLDGNLAGDAEAALEARLATDVEARDLLAEYRGLDRVLRSTPLPAIDFDALAGRISDAVSQEEAPAQSYRMTWVRTVMSLALAACVVVAAGVGIFMLQKPAAQGPGAQVAISKPHGEPKQIVVVDAVTRAAPSTAPITAVAVGPSAAPQDHAAFARYHEDLLSRPSQVIIARSGYAMRDEAAQDGSFLPN